VNQDGGSKNSRRLPLPLFVAFRSIWRWDRGATRPSLLRWSSSIAGDASLPGGCRSTAVAGSVSVHWVGNPNGHLLAVRGSHNWVLREHEGRAAPRRHGKPTGRGRWARSAARPQNPKVLPRTRERRDYCAACPPRRPLATAREQVFFEAQLSPALPRAPVGAPVAFKKKAGSRIREPRARRQSGGRGGGGRRHGVGFSRGQMRARRPFAAVTAASRACPCLCPRAGDLGLSLPATLWLPAMFACPCAAYNFFQSHPTHRPTAWSSPCSTDVSPVPQPFVLATCSTAGARASPGCDSLCARLRASERASERASALGPALSLSAQGWASGWVRWADAWRQCNAAHSVRMDMTLC
jgi:hypothetical protein